MTCRPGDDPAGPSGCLFTTKTHIDGFKETYIYEDGVVRSLIMEPVDDPSYTYTFQYGANGDLTSITGPSDKTMFTYANGLIVKKDYTRPNSSTHTEYEYSGDLLVRIDEFTEGPPFIFSGYRKLEYSGPDLVRIKYFFPNAGSPNALVDYTLGNKKSVESALPEAIKKWRRLGGFFSEKILLHHKTIFGDETNYTYEFNSFGYPTKMWSSSTMWPSSYETYEYQCD